MAMLSPRSQGKRTKHIHETAILTAHPYDLRPRTPSPLGKEGRGAGALSPTQASGGDTGLGAPPADTLTAPTHRRGGGPGVASPPCLPCWEQHQQQAATHPTTGKPPLALPPAVTPATGTCPPGVRRHRATTQTTNTGSSLAAGVRWRSGRGGWAQQASSVGERTLTTGQGQEQQQGLREGVGGGPKQS